MDAPLAATAGHVFGYHGTSELQVQSILREGFMPSQNSYDWLGSGIYFFDSAPGTAMSWAQRHFGSQAAVLKSEIDLTDALDLLDSTEMAVLREYARVIDIESMSLRQISGRNEKDCYLINTVCAALEDQRGTPVTAVRAAFREGKPVFPGSEIFDLSHVQIVVRDPSCISQTIPGVVA